MPGLPQKPLDMLQRPRKGTTRAKLHDGQPRTSYPLPDGDWHPMAVEFWDDLWTSPMASEYMRMDRHRLYHLLRLIDTFWRKPTVGLAAEIRQQSQGFGLSPLDRRRLQWEIERGESADQKRAARKPPAEPVKDPRSMLKSVS